MYDIYFHTTIYFNLFHRCFKKIFKLIILRVIEYSIFIKTFKYKIFEMTIQVILKHVYIIYGRVLKLKLL